MPVLAMNLPALAVGALMTLFPLPAGWLRQRADLPNLALFERCSTREGCNDV